MGEKILNQFNAQVPMGGIDAVSFTAGIGEKSSMKRERMLEMLEPLGFRVDKERNDSHGKDSDGFVTAEDSPKAAIVVKADEELMIARETLEVLNRA